MSQISLNYSTANTDKLPLLEWVRKLKELSNEYIELGFTQARRIPETLTEDLLSESRTFKGVYIHAPVKDGDDWIRYPSKRSDMYISKLKRLSDGIPNVEYILFHPDLVDDFEYLNKSFGDKLAFENIDSKKEFGKSVEDMMSVFERSPQAGWVCDVNHLYTVDKSMDIAQCFHEAFSDRLRYYHVSAYGGFHDLFIRNPNEIKILSGVLDLSKPLIHEGFSDPEVIPELKGEDKVVREWFSEKI